MAFRSFLRSFVLSPPARQVLESDFEQAFAKYCEPPLDESRKQCVIPQSSFKNIQTLLKQSEDKDKADEWSLRPRIFTILRRIGRLDVMREFIASGYNDDSLPFDTYTLPHVLGEDKHAFIVQQEFCLTDAVEFEKGETGKHVHFSHNGDQYFIHIKALGSGGFGHVDLVWSRLSCRTFARKKISRSATAEQTAQRFKWYAREIGALKTLSHKHLVKIKGTYSDPGCFAFLMDPVAECNLHQYLRKITDDQMGNLRTFFGCLVNAVVYLHKTNVHHFDLKPQNILIKRGQIFLTDFGAAHDFSQRDRSTTYDNTPRTAKYMPPEQASNPFSAKSWWTDVWSLGVVFFEMTTVLRRASLKDLEKYFLSHGTQEPFVHNNAMAANRWLEKLRKMNGSEYDNLPLIWIKDMLTRSPRQRPQAVQIRASILGAQGFCGPCCASEEQIWEVIPNMNTRDLSDNNSEVDFAPADDFVATVEEPSSLEPERISKIESWITHNTMTVPQLQKADSTVHQLPFDVEDDDEQPKTQLLALNNEFQDPVPNRLVDIDIFLADDSRAETSSHEADRDSEHLLFDVVSDGSQPKSSNEFDGGELPVDQQQLKTIEEELESVSVANSSHQGSDQFFDASEDVVAPPQLDLTSTHAKGIVMPNDSGVRPLTIENLRQLEHGATAESSTENKARKYRARFKSRIVARKYMKQIWEKETEAATSVMSDATRDKLKGLSLTVSADTNSSILVGYVKTGKVAAVRERDQIPEPKHNRPCRGPLMQAIRGASLNHNKCADALLRAGADVNLRTARTNRSMLSIAIEHDPFPGYHGLIWTSLHWGADPNVKDRNGDFPLLQILYGGFGPLKQHKREALALILEQSSSPTTVSIRPPGTLNMPLHLAVRRKDPWAVAMLLEKGADYAAKNGAGQTPFALAVSTWVPDRLMTKGHKEVVRLLLAQGADPNEKLGTDESLALHSAIRNGHTDLVAILMRYLADPLLTDAKQQNAFDICKDPMVTEKLSASIIKDMKSIMMQHDEHIEWRSGSSESSPEDALSDRDTLDVSFHRFDLLLGTEFPTTT